VLVSARCPVEPIMEKGTALRLGETFKVTKLRDRRMLKRKRDGSEKTRRTSYRCQKTGAELGNDIENSK